MPSTTAGGDTAGAGHDDHSGQTHTHPAGPITEAEAAADLNTTEHPWAAWVNRSTAAPDRHGRSRRSRGDLRTVQSPRLDQSLNDSAVPPDHDSVSPSAVSCVGTSVTSATDRRLV
jgi:hypothetical protein